jgi:hypothetical protein
MHTVGPRINLQGIIKCGNFCCQIYMKCVLCIFKT